MANLGKYGRLDDRVNKAAEPVNGTFASPWIFLARGSKRDLVKLETS